MNEKMRTRVRDLPPRVRELLRELYEREDWKEVRFNTGSPDIRSRWSSDYARSKHLKNLHMLGVLRLTPGLGGWMSTVPDEDVRRAVLEGTAPKRGPVSRQVELQEDDARIFQDRGRS